MKLKLWLASAFVTGLVTGSPVWADSWSDDSSSGAAWQPAQPVVVNKSFEKECSACHFAYPASFLPAASWTKIMNSLDQHFGENAELDASTKTEIERYLRENASNRFIPSRLLGGEVPLRITETSYFRREHNEIPSRMVTGNSQVGSFSNCLACHTQAKRGSFRESEVWIPNYGRWD